MPNKITINQDGKKFAEVIIEEYKLNSGIKTGRPQQETMKSAASSGGSPSRVLPAGAETSLERGQRVDRRAVAALGGESFLQMQDRVETGRAYSFYRENLSGLSLAQIYTRYLTRPEPPVARFRGSARARGLRKKCRRAR